MKYDVCHASKDFIREARLAIDSLIYSETRAMETRPMETSIIGCGAHVSAFQSFCTMMIPLLKTGEEMTEALLFLSSYEPLIAIAENAGKELFSARKSLEEAKKNYDPLLNEEERVRFLEKSRKIIERLWDDLVSSDISERLCCDYLNYMLCILEGGVRLCGCVSEYEKTEECFVFERSLEMRLRELMHSMKSLLSLIK